jgi:hypothetical protein
MSLTEIQARHMWEINLMIDRMNSTHKSDRGCARCGIPARERGKRTRG